MGFLDNLEAYLDFSEEVDKQEEPKSEVGYSTGKWSDDDDYKGPITPFYGKQR